MTTEPKTVATVQLGRDDEARGQIRVALTPEGWEIDCLTPEGVREEGHLPAFATRMQALDAIEATWGRDTWGLQWI